MIKYPKITSDIKLIDGHCIVQEKIDGANFCIHFTRGAVRFYSRNQQTNINFYGANEHEFMDYALPLLQDAANMFFTDKFISEVRFFGELYGNNIQKRLNYGATKWIAFDIMLNDKFLAYDELLSRYPFAIDWLVKADLYMLPLFTNISVEEALLIDVETLKSQYSLKDEVAEGIVIKPQKKVLYDKNGDIMYIKKKREKFFEKKVEKPIENTDVLYWNAVFQTYLNDNRIKSVFSKEGEIKDKKDFGKYLKLIIQDMKEDFLREEPIDMTKFNKSQQHLIFRIENKVIDELSKYL